MAEQDDWAAIWPIVEQVVRAGETYAYDRNMTQEEAYDHWMAKPKQTFVCEESGRILGTYYIKTNQLGGGNHVANCGYMVSVQARGKGLAKALCQHSLDVASSLGYLAMQFNFVVSTNTIALHCWHQLGFETVGRLPRAFDHPSQGLVDAFMLYRWLAPTEASTPGS